jgi:hypothetical protein
MLMRNRFLVFLFLLILPVAVHAQGVVSAADPRAAEAGREVLHAGGTAADAAMAMMLALSVVEPQSSGIGGGGFLLYQDAKSGKLTTVDGREEGAGERGTDALPRARREAAAVRPGLSGRLFGGCSRQHRADGTDPRQIWQTALEAAVRSCDSSC